MLEIPWTGGQLKRLSRQIRDGLALDPKLPSYGDVMLWYNDLAAQTQKLIEEQDWTPLLGDRKFETASRPKTIDTLRDKLLRESSIPLPSVQDIAGVRFEAEMSLDEQDAVATAICGLFDHDPATAVKDLRADPHSGYRAVHLWLRFPARVEVQIRTHMQSAWANMYERAADEFGRSIRYGEFPTDANERRFVEELQSLSTQRIALLEESRRDVHRLQIAAEDPHLVSSSESLNAVRLERLHARVSYNERTLRDEMDHLVAFFNGLSS